MDCFTIIPIADAQEASSLPTAWNNALQISDSNPHIIEAGMTSVKLIVPLHVRPAFFLSESNLLLLCILETIKLLAVRLFFPCFDYLTALDFRQHILKI